MSISILGAGNVGMALTRALLAQQQSVILGVRDPARHEAGIAGLGPQVRVASMGAAIEASDIVILAVPYEATDAIARSVADWEGKILVDATNPLAAGLRGLLLGTDTSGAEHIAAAARGARVVKAFNSTGAENMANTRYGAGRPFMPVCGDDEPARRRVLELATSIGFDAVDLGGLAAARYIEPLAMVWIQMAIKQGKGRQFALGLLRRDA